MLVLSRRVGERILIGDNIAVTVVRLAPGVVRLGVEAPDNYSIIRAELRDRAEKASTTPSDAPSRET